MNTIPEIDNDWMEEIQKASSEDLSLTKLIKKIREGWPKYLHYLDDDLKVYHKFKNELRTENGLIREGWPKYLHYLDDDLKVYHKFKNELRTENGLILKVTK
ncbi:hypothetical protein QE152_g33185 [Popillia japonica]|uniref:Uncharacterized protein n=1 Tax=Popillia japonica TaxID=7064 RepID=A0AAW1IXZ0_POPJA